MLSDKDLLLPRQKAASSSALVTMGKNLQKWKDYGLECRAALKSGERSEALDPRRGLHYLAMSFSYEAS